MAPDNNPGRSKRSGFSSYDLIHLIAGLAVERIALTTGLLASLGKALMTAIPGLGTAYAALISVLVFFVVGVIGSYFWLVPPLKSITSKWQRRGAVAGVMLLFALVLGITASRPM